MCCDSLRIFIGICAVCYGVPVITQNESKDICYREEEEEMYSPSLESNVPTSPGERKEYCVVGYEKMPEVEFTEIFQCDSDYFIMRDCLRCGKVPKLPAVCPRSKSDDPSRFLNCSECLRGKQACHNNGTMDCPNTKSYAIEMTCHCQNGFTGNLCENKVNQVYRTCQCSKNKSTENINSCERSSHAPCYIERLNGYICICGNKNEDKPDVPNCSNLDVVHSKLKKNRPRIISKSTQVLNNSGCTGYDRSYVFMVSIIVLHYVYR